MTAGDELLVRSYDPHLLVLSAIIALIASRTALDLGSRVAAASGGSRLAWLISGAAMGTGIWSMHFIAMLAFSLPVPVLYDWPTGLRHWNRYWQTFSHPSSPCSW